MGKIKFSIQLVKSQIIILIRCARNCLLLDLAVLLFYLMSDAQLVWPSKSHLLNFHGRFIGDGSAWSPDICAFNKVFSLSTHVYFSLRWQISPKISLLFARILLLQSNKEFLFPLSVNSEIFARVLFSLNVSEYDQEIPQSHTADQPTAS